MPKYKSAPKRTQNKDKKQTIRTRTGTITTAQSCSIFNTNTSNNTVKIRFTFGNTFKTKI